MSKLASQWVELFRAGDYGDKGTYSAADIQQIASNYKPSFHEAPLRIGHTDDDKAPAYGWLESLKASGDLLLGKFKQVVPAFGEAVEKGSFKKRSIGLKDYGHGLTVRHVAFLGAVPPECKGLADIAFSQDDKDVTEIEFSEEMDMTEVEQRTFNERMKAFFKEMWGGSALEAKTFSEAEVKNIATEAAAAAVTAAVAPLEVRLKASETKFSERETVLTSAESTARADAAIARVKAKGAWVPAFEKMGLPLIFSALAEQTVTIEFGEGTAKAQKTKLEIFTEFMEGLGKIVPAGAINIATGRPRTAVPAGTDPKATELHERTLEFAEKNKVNYGTAQLRVIQENPELGMPSAISAGVA